MLVFGTSGTQDAIANGDTRTLNLVHTHTKETASITFKRNGAYDSKGLEQLNWFLRDWRTDQPTKMEPRLFDIVWEVYRSVGASDGIHVVSAYRAPETNAMLRRRSKAVSEYSQHMAGKAMDFFLPGVDMARVRATAMRLQYGGVGFYPNSAHSFVHLDAGSVRAWPRMTRGQLLALFPNGKTVHLPSSGPPLPRYEEARAEVLARGGTVRGVSYASADDSGGRRRSLWATLFGGSDDEEESDRSAAAPARGRLGPNVAAYAPTTGDDAGTKGVAVASSDKLSARRGVQTASAEPSPAPRTAAPAESQNAVPANALALAPMPPRRPEDLPALASFALPPVPPSRPVEIASAAMILLPTRTDATSGPDTTAAINPPLPVPRPAGATAENRAELRALFAAVLSKVDAGARARIAMARVKAQADAPSGLIATPAAGLAQGFSQKPADLSASRFAGPAAKPLPTLR